MFKFCVDRTIDELGVLRMRLTGQQLYALRLYGVSSRAYIGYALHSLTQMSEFFV